MSLSKTTYFVSSLSFLLFFYSNCHSPSPLKASAIHDGSFSYNLSNPSEKWVLPGELREISGLSYTPAGQLACIQDENGLLYLLDFEEKKITKRLSFAKNSDYEGVEIIGDTAYVLRSDGTLFVFYSTAKTISATKINTSLSKKNDAEGLAFDPVTHQLLIACKGNAGTKNGGKIKGRAIYAYDLKQRKLSDSPAYLIKTKPLKESLDKSNLNPKKHDFFRFSGIAIHPVTKKIYIIGTVGKLLLIIDRTGRINTSVHLQPNIFLQPEGICFDPEGNLYISSEGKSGKGYVLKFTPGPSEP